MKKKVALIVLDGFGVSKKVEGNAVKKAKMPFYNNLIKQCPWSLLRASGKFVGLKKGQMGNSETGHMNIGAGRIVSQDLTKIDYLIFNDELKNNKSLVKFFNDIKQKNGDVHFVGLCSNGGVHSHIDHLFALVKLAKDFGIKNCYIHFITDGRDTDMHSAIMFVKQLENLFNKLSYGKIATIGGRFYAMDRDKKYENTFEAYNAILGGVGIEITNPVKYLKQCYEKGITDEYIIPAVVVENEKPVAKFDNQKDGLMFFNFRKDRTKQLTESFILDNFNQFKTYYKVNNFLSMTSYGENFSCDNIIKNEVVKDCLVEVLSKHNKIIAKFAEPTKFPHVTYFLNGGREQPFDNEDWFKVPAKNVKTFLEAPQLSAIELANEVVTRCSEKDYDFIMLNLANCDIVGHTGDFNATVKAIETCDDALRIMVPFLIKNGFDVLITADHGNSEQMIFRNKPCTTHSNNPVRLVYVGDKDKKVHNGTLVDLSPTILSLFGIDYPSEYTGKNLIK